MSGESEPTVKKRRLRVIAFAVGGLALVMLAGCGHLSYYTQAARGHFGVISKARPIPEVLQEKNTSEELKRKLNLVLEARKFAEERLRLEGKGHYLRYADLGRDSVVYNVYAAPEFSLESKRWWYPIIGHQSYRGYFAKEAAIACAKELKEEGYDTYVGGVDAYSTLGWFKDPVLNTWINDDDEEVVSLVIHELTHQRLYIDGDTAFNEAFATAVEIVGTRLWLKEKGREDKIAEWEAQQKRRSEFIQLVKRTRTELAQIYGTEPPSDEALARRRKVQSLDTFRAELETLRSRWNSKTAFSSWLKKAVNNARLNTVSTYYDLVPAFLKLLEQQNHDFETFYAEVRRIGRMPKPERHAYLSALEGANADTRAVGFVPAGL